jgi:predicted Zn-ribbon and HTH transcriptional regulator
LSKRKAAMPPLRVSTLRESLHQALLSGPATARDLSRIVGIPERSVPQHLEHLAKSLRPKGERLEIEPSECLDCDAAFTKRERYTRPGRCPRCHSRRISLPRFRIEGHGKNP